MLLILLQHEGGDDLYMHFIEEVVTDKTQVRFDPSVINKKTNPRHIDFAWTTVDHNLRAAFCA